MWKLGDVITLAERERAVRVARGFSEAALAFERLNGRTNETYDRAKARAELEQALETFELNELPQMQVGYAGLREFLAYLEMRQRLAHQWQAAPERRHDRDR